LTYPMNRPDLNDEIGGFLGASYFRFLGRASAYGLSARGQTVAIFKVIAGERKFGRHAALHIKKLHRFGKQPAHVKGGQTEGRVQIRPAFAVGQKVDLTIIVIAQRRQKGVGQRGRFRIRLPGQKPHLFGQDVKGKGRWLRCSGVLGMPAQGQTKHHRHRHKGRGRLQQHATGNIDGTGPGPGHVCL
ncbi:MAG: hypothetical protein EBU97_04315, partial [Rhodobacteraceae bacterium]|nr:hypothetical protein [Paracoccaceae bacterium]